MEGIRKLEMVDDDFMAFLWYGLPGMWKTTSAAKLAHERKLFIDIAGKMKSQFNLTSEERSKIDIWTPGVPLDGESAGIQISRKEQYDSKKNVIPGTQAYVPKNPQGYLRTVNFINELAKQDPFPYDLVVLDDLTKLSEHMEYLIYAHHKVGVMSLPLWGVYKNNVNNFLSGFLELPCDVILIAHAKDIKENDEAPAETRPMIDGSSANKIPKDFNEVYFFFKGNDGQGYVKTAGDARYVARTTLGFPKEMPTVKMIEELNKRFAARRRKAA